MRTTAGSRPATLTKGMSYVCAIVCTSASVWVLVCSLRVVSASISLFLSVLVWLLYSAQACYVCCQCVRVCVCVSVLLLYLFMFARV